MKKLLFVIDSLNGGGAEKVLFDIFNNLSYEDYQVDLFLLRNEGVYLEKIKRNKKIKVNIEFLIPVRNYISKNKIYKKIRNGLGLVKIYFYCKYPFLIRKLKNKNYDIEIAFLEGYSNMLIANRKNNSKKISWVHIDLEKHKIMGISRKIERKSYKNIDKIICVSEDSKQSIIKLYPENKNKIQVIYNPIDKNNILEKSKEKIEINKNKINIITVGRLSYQKGYDILLHSHNKLIKSGLDYNLIFLGEGSERKNMEKYIRENNLESNTKLLGFKENPYPYLKEADIFVSSSRYEGYPLVLCEAVCLEKPIVATSCTGPKEILEKGKYGLLAEVENIDDLAEKMKLMILGEEIRKKYSKLSEERSKIFDIERTMKEIENLFG